MSGPNAQRGQPKPAGPFIPPPMSSFAAFRVASVEVLSVAAGYVRNEAWKNRAEPKKRRMLRVCIGAQFNRCILPGRIYPAPTIAIYIGKSLTRQSKTKQKHPRPQAGVHFMVDDNGLEPLTLRTSSECSTS